MDKMIKLIKLRSEVDTLKLQHKMCDDNQIKKELKTKLDKSIKVLEDFRNSLNNKRLRVYPKTHN